MDSNVKALWLSALRSGEYKQGRGQLAENTEGGMRYCCLGVLCDVAIKQDMPVEVLMGDNGEVRFDGVSLVIPESVRQWAGMDDANPSVYEVSGDDYSVTLAELNDGNSVNNIRTHTFEEIADVIEEKL